MLALGNVAGGPPLFRDMVLSSGALFPLLQLLNGHTKLSILRKATGALWNFCRSLPPANFEQVWLCSDGILTIYTVLCLIWLAHL